MNWKLYLGSIILACWVGVVTSTVVERVLAAVPNASTTVVVESAEVSGYLQERHDHMVSELTEIRADVTAVRERLDALLEEM